jgi:hypothetical protein
MEEIEEEILLRFPPQEPALLVRAALVCKRWRRLVSGHRFRRRYRELHRTPPMLGFLCNIGDFKGPTAGFVATTAFCSPDADLGGYSPLDARHGRVLLRCPGSWNSSEVVLMVWDPIADKALQLPVPHPRRYIHYWYWTAAVLCASTATGPCDHLDCHRGPFLVVCAGYGGNGGEAFISTYSSDAGTWNEPIITTDTELPLDDFLTPSVLVGKALYFGFVFGKTLLKYDLESHEVSVIGVPHTLDLWRHFLLDDGLALATVQESKLCIWRKAISPEGDAGWTQDRVIELKKLFPGDSSVTLSNVVGFADGIDVIFLRAFFTLYTIDLKTYEAKRVCNHNIYSAIPYMSFCTPGTILLGFWSCNIQNEL